MNDALGAVRRVLAHPRYGAPLKVVAAYVLLVEVLLQLLLGKVPILGIGRGEQEIPREIFLHGMVIGSLYALVAMGLILIYRANRVINFAQAQLGSVPAVIALILVAKRGMPYLLAIPIVLIGGALLGAVSEVGLIRRFSNAPRLILTVVTIGLGFLLLILEFYSKQWVGGSLVDTINLQFPTPFQHLSFRMGVKTFTGDHVMAVAVTGAAVAGLSAFFRFTDIGIAVRASAENAERASLLGIPVKRVSTIVWILAATLSAVGVFLRAPLTGLPLTGFVGPTILLYGLAVAVMARMESLPTAFLAGMFVGIVEQATVFSTNRSAYADAAMLVLVLAALLLQRNRLSRALEMGASSWQAVREVRSIPSELRRLPEVVETRRGLLLALGALVVGIPFTLGDANTPNATIVVIYAMIGVSLVILTGWSGQISLGQYAIAGVGAATAGGLAANHGFDFFVTLVAGALAGLVIAVLVGLPALRIQGLFLAVTTLAFAFTVQSLLTRDDLGWLLPASGKLVNRPVLWNRIDLNTDSTIGPFHLSPDAKFFYVCVLFLLLVMGMAHSLRRLRSGRVLLSVRDNGRVAQAFGINLARTRLAAFAASGAIAGLAGALLAYQNQAFADNQFAPEKSIQLFVMAVIGGMGSLPGAVLGAVFIKGIPLLPGLADVQQIELLTSGLGLLVLLNFLPGGLAEGMYRVRDSWLRRVALRNGIHVPSLLADAREPGGDAERDGTPDGVPTGADAAELVDASAEGEPAGVIP